MESFERINTPPPVSPKSGTAPRKPRPEPARPRRPEPDEQPAKPPGEPQHEVDDYA